MARKLRVEYKGAIYHVTCRMLGDAKSKLFVSPSDRERFLDSLSERVEQYNIRLYMYVLMNNHFHLVFETPEGNCSKFMHSLSTSYTVYYNLRHNRHGHLFDGRYKSRLVDGDEYLLSLSRYVHLNPVKVMRMRNKPLEQKLPYLRQYSWSSYAGYINKRKRVEFVEYLPVLSEMPGKGEKDWSRNYKRFVESGVAKDDVEFNKILKMSPKSIGGKEFNKWVDNLYQKIVDGYGSVEDVSFRHVIEPVSVDIVLKTIVDIFSVELDSICKKNGDGLIRAIVSRYLMRYSGKSQREIALLLGVSSGSAISRSISRYKEILSSDKKLINYRKG
jgi:REP element-mobilizing transposase RayT